MTKASACAMAVVPLGLVACGAVPWRERGQLRVTVIVKATFGFVPGGPMSLLPPEPLVTAEVHHGHSPARSIALSSDLAPHLAYADVVLTGHAHAPEGTATPALTARLVVARGGVLLDKSLHVEGDLSGDVTVPFERMPLVYERAYGGAGYLDNPLGVGVGSGARRPNITDPRRPNVAAGFGPIARGWPARKGRITPEQRKAIDKATAEVPEGFDYSYYQSAPVDQRIEHLHGDEWIVLEGMHPHVHALRTGLPGVRALARFYGPAFEGLPPIELRADTLRIDADEQRCSVTWRASLPVPDEAALASMGLAGGVSVAGSAIDWPHHVGSDPSRHAVTTPLDPPRADGAPSSRHDRTIAMDEAAPAPARPSLDGTMVMTAQGQAEVQREAPLPFSGPVSSRPGEALVHGAIPGAPWGPAAPVSQPMASSGFDRTYDGEDAAVEPDAPVGYVEGSAPVGYVEGSAPVGYVEGSAPVGYVEPVAPWKGASAATEGRVEDASPRPTKWREDTAAPAPAPERARPAARPTVKNDLYKRFGKR